jgi:colanic acid biosynthesis glycosyl transferase WcaI
VVLSAAGESAALIEDASCGVVVPPEQPVELAAALRDLAGDRSGAEGLGAAGRRAAEQQYSRELAIDGWYGLLEEVVR